MEAAKSALATCELPTGVVVEGEVVKEISFREMSGYEEDILASRKMKTSAKLSNLMSNCIIKFGDIEDRQTINKLVKKMLITDRWFFLTQLRVVSLGKSYKFPSVCPECSKEDKLVYDLDGLKIKNAPLASALYRELTLPSGKTARIKAGDGSVEEKIETMSTDENAASIGILARIAELNDSPVGVDAVKSLSWADRQFLRKEIDKLEGELEDDYEAVCPGCGHEYKGTLPLSAENFFFPSV